MFLACFEVDLKGTSKQILSSILVLYFFQFLRIPIIIDIDSSSFLYKNYPRNIKESILKLKFLIYMEL
jgi:hypothetical protein